MRPSDLQSALHTAFFLIALAASVRAENAPKAAVPERQLQAKIEYCKTCHGLSGQGYRGSIPMPRLAGQQSEYLEDQLRAFIERKRPSFFMSKVADVLSPPMQKALASRALRSSPISMPAAPASIRWSIRRSKSSVPSTGANHRPRRRRGCPGHPVDWRTAPFTRNGPDESGDFHANKSRQQSARADGEENDK